MSTAKDNEKSMFKILIASDIHLGYSEKDPIIGEDTFVTFEEILKIAVEKEVDLILLGGDLFHENKPSAKSMTKCIELLRKYCLGDKSIQFEIISDQRENFKHTDLFPLVNYEDQNINISMPVFSIHGNHDDPVGKDRLCALETISAAGLVNYFGKQMNLEEIVLSPILMRKGGNHLALYGLGSCPEERLHRMFLKKKIQFLSPTEDEHEWFNVFVVHQNRVQHGTKYLPESFLSNLPHLVVWGHEHESIPNVEWNPQQEFYVFQPGSTVITSLCPGEAKPKHVGLLSVYHNGNENCLKITPIPLQTVRQFYFEDISLKEISMQANYKLNEATLTKFCTDKVNEILFTAESEHSGDERQPKEPLIRLRIDHCDQFKTISGYQFGQQFVGRVANPKEILLFKRKRALKGNGDGDEKLSRERLDEILEADQTVRCDIEDVIKEYFENADRKSRLTMLDETSLTNGIKTVVEKDASIDEIEKIINRRLNKVIKELLSKPDLLLDETSFIDACFELKEQVKNEDEEESKCLKAAIQNRKQSSTRNDKNDNGFSNDIDDDDDDEVMIVDSGDDDDDDELNFASSSKLKRGRGRTSRGRATGGRSTSRAKRGGGVGNTGRAKNQNVFDSLSESD